MKIINHIKIALLFGFLTGLLIGIVDILGRVFIWSFQWFELYLALFTSILIVTVIFFILSLIIELIRTFLRLKINDKILCFSVSIAFLFLYYGVALADNFFIPYDFKHPFSMTVNGTIFIISGLIFLFLFFKKNITLNMISFMQKGKIKKILTNIIFTISVFVIISFIMDVFLLYYVPTYESSKDISEYPNVILITFDSVRADHLSLYGYPLNTSPNLDKFTEQAVVFTNAISTASWSLPSYSSLVTGKYSKNHGANLRTQYLDEDELLLAEILKENGYVTVGFSGGIYTKLKYGVAQGLMTHNDRLDFFEHIHTFEKLNIRSTVNTVFPWTDEFLFKSDGEKSAEELNKEIFKWLDKNNDQTFFMYIDYNDPHTPYNLGSEFQYKFTDLTLDYSEVEEVLAKKRYANVPDFLIDYLIAIYDTEIFYLDFHIKKFFKELEELNLMDKTLIVILADHGQEFYEHGHFEHADTLYEEVIHVPLIIHYPKELNAKRIEKRISTVDILPTILDVLQIEVPEQIDGESLTPLIENKIGYSREYTLSELYGRAGKEEFLQQIALSNQYWKLIEVEPDIETLPSSLFNLMTDPQEQRNLYDVYPDKRKELQQSLAALTGADNLK